MRGRDRLTRVLREAHEQGPPSISAHIISRTPDSHPWYDRSEVACGKGLTVGSSSHLEALRWSYACYGTWSALVVDHPSRPCLVEPLRTKLKIIHGTWTASYFAASTVLTLFTSRQPPQICRPACHRLCTTVLPTTASSKEATTPASGARPSTSCWLLSCPVGGYLSCSWAP